MQQLRIFTSFRKAIRRLSPEEKGQLFDAMLAYADDKTLLPLTGRADAIWDFVQEMLDAQHASYERQCAVNKKNIEKRYESLRTDTNCYESKQVNLSLSNFDVQGQEQVQVQDKLSQEKVKKRESSAFRAPSVDEVRAYCSERGNDVDAEHFVAYYQSNGWKVGRNPMKDWKAAVRSWEKRDLERGEPKTTNQFLQLLMEEGGHL